MINDKPHMKKERFPPKVSATHYQFSAHRMAAFGR